jgi:hypothetical protein
MDLQKSSSQMRCCCESRDPDKVSRRVADVLKDVASLEILQAPGLPFIIPDQFSGLPCLTGHP